MTDEVRCFVDAASIRHAGIDLHSREIKVRRNTGQVLKDVECVPPWAFNNLSFICVGVRGMSLAEMNTALTMRYTDTPNNTRLFRGFLCRYGNTYSAHACGYSTETQEIKEDEHVASLPAHQRGGTMTSGR